MAHRTSTERLEASPWTIQRFWVLRPPRFAERHNDVLAAVEERIAQRRSGACSRSRSGIATDAAQLFRARYQRCGRSGVGAASVLILGVTLACAPNPGPTVLALSPAPASEDGDLGDTPPPLNATEARIVRSLATLGIAAAPVQHNVGTTVDLWARFDDGTELFVSTYPVGRGESGLVLLDEREIDGVSVERVRSESGSLYDRFGCGNLTFLVGGALPPGYDDLDAFLAAVRRTSDRGLSRRRPGCGPRAWPGAARRRRPGTGRAHRPRSRPGPRPRPRP
jgi:hypothetical protein